VKTVIQGAARKTPGAGSLAAADGRPILFVATWRLRPPTRAVYLRGQTIARRTAGHGVPALWRTTMGPTIH
jgi:hypothetical protein